MRPGETYVSALGRALARLGRRYYVAHGSDTYTTGITGAGQKIVDEEEFTIFAVATTTSTDPDARWVLAHCSPRDEVWDDLTRSTAWRERLLRANLDVLDTTNPAITPRTELTRARRATGMARARHEVMLTAWWDDRMAEGHTVESAQMLLALTAHPTLLASLVYDPTTGIPSLPQT